LSTLSYEEMKKRGEIAGKFHDELVKEWREEGIVYEPSVIARRPSIPQKKGNGVGSIASYYLRYCWYWIWSGIHYLFVETQRP